MVINLRYRKGKFGFNRVVFLTALIFVSSITTMAQWQLFWSDEFNAAAHTKIDTSKWYYNEWNPGTANGERQKTAMPCSLLKKPRMCASWVVSATI
jgi:hypothetical protein